MRAFTLSLAGAACIFTLMLVASGAAKAQPSAPALSQTNAGSVEEVGYRYRRYRYGYRAYRPYYRPYGYYYRPYYGYGYGYPYYRPYYGYGYGYPYYRPYYYGWRPGISLWFGF
jgi:hypothetical protein